ncbi:uncharacterized protein LOC110893443 [Helianthus annuus]|uniref:uncharacterized protein LOC110893443 n=1 Tax=Helianthus annuus TaxID=4232 RepID=UPI000B8FB7C4|nr:uncharacterized protein LOC110893443 [Helianthus annuus]
MVKDCRAPFPKQQQQQPQHQQRQQPHQNQGNRKGSFQCGDESHIKRDYPQLNQNANDNNNHQNNNNNAGNNNNGNNSGNGARGRVFTIGAGDARNDGNVVTGLTPTPLETKHVVELADGKPIEASYVLLGCKLDLLGQVFDIDLLPVTLGSFNVVVGMDWLSKHRVDILCKEKIVRIPLPGGESLPVQGHRSGALIRSAQAEALTDENLKAEEMLGLEKQLVERSDGMHYFMERIWVPLYGNLRELVMDEAHKFRYSVHPGSDKMYQDLKVLYRWPKMKAHIAVYVGKCLTCAKVKVEYQKPSGLLQQPEIPMWKWEQIAMDFVTGLPRNQNRNDTIWI